MRARRLLPCLLLCAAALPHAGAGPAPRFRFARQEGSLEIRLDGRPVASYVFADARIPRPYFAHLRAPDGAALTRSHPPVPGRDPTDHDLFHPGVWLAFGDLGGADNWRNRAPVRHDGFAAGPDAEGERAGFTVRRSYLPAGGTEALCLETCRYSLLAREGGWLLISDSAFTAEGAGTAFGDQEEMGLGVRVATPLAVRQGGRIRNSEGGENEAGAWGRQADWCDYSGTADGRRAGVLLMADPANFRRSWFHVRDYGLMVANPFGRNAFTKGERSRVPLAAGETLRLRYGLFFYSAPAAGAPDPARVYREFLGRSAAPGAAPPGNPNLSSGPPPPHYRNCPPGPVS